MNVRVLRNCVPVHWAFLAVLVGGVGCASAAPAVGVPPTRAEIQRPTAHVPEQVASIREGLSAQRADMNARLSTQRPGSETMSIDDGTPWYSPLFDVADALASVTRLIPFIR